MCNLGYSHIRFRCTTLLLIRNTHSVMFKIQLQCDIRSQERIIIILLFVYCSIILGHS